MTENSDNRRPIKARSSALAILAARGLARAGISANAVSVASLVFAAIAALALIAAPRLGWTLTLVAAIACPLRLLANLLDGMVAVEHAKSTPTGPLYNEIPDRLADVVILAAAGAAAAAGHHEGVLRWGELVGWLAAAAALLTAYVRELGRTLGAPADFSGPFAKQHRMWVITAAALCAAILPSAAAAILFSAVLLVALGTAFTAARRLHRLAAYLRQQAVSGGP